MLSAARGKTGEFNTECLPKRKSSLQGTKPERFGEANQSMTQDSKITPKSQVPL